MVFNHKIIKEIDFFKVRKSFSLSSFSYMWVEVSNNFENEKFKKNPKNKIKSMVFSFLCIHMVPNGAYIILIIILP